MSMIRPPQGLGFWGTASNQNMGRWSSICMMTKTWSIIIWASTKSIQLYVENAELPPLTVTVYDLRVCRYSIAMWAHCPSWIKMLTVLSDISL